MNLLVLVTERQQNGLLSMNHNYSTYTLQVAARKEDDDSVASGGMVLDLTAELGGLVQETLPLAETNKTSTESQATNQTTSVVSQQCTDPNVSRRKLKT
jgi:hypothetical protein